MRKDGVAKALVGWGARVGSSVDFTVPFIAEVACRFVILIPTSLIPLGA